MKKYAIIVAGGKGTRFGSNIPKQFLNLCGTPVLMHTINRFAQCECEIIVVLPQSQIYDWNELCTIHAFHTPHTIVPGGNTRFHSVKNAIDTISPCASDLIAVHDGVRPLVDCDIITNAFNTASTHLTAIPAIQVTDSIREICPNQNHSKALNRATLRAVQTPQTFNAMLLKKAYNTAFSETFTDDASVVEAAGHNITLIDGSPKNIKITHSIDLIIAEELIKQ